MTDNRRGLLTEREREILASNGDDVTEKYYGVVVTRARQKIERVADDIPALEAHPTLADELHEIVCADDSAPENVAASIEEEDTPEPADNRESAESRPENLAKGVEELGLGPNQQTAVNAMVAYLREHGTAQKSDFIEDVYPVHSADYDSEEGWWNALGKGTTTAESKGSLGDLPGVKKPERGPTWRWVGDE